VGGAARTDLVAKDMTEPLTRALFATRRAFDDLPDETVVLPTHGVGSFCSTGSGDSRTSTLGAERDANPVLAFEGDEDAFVRWFPSTFPGTPAYYARMRAFNAAGPRLLREIPPPPPLEPPAFDAASRGPGALVVDVRRSRAYAAAHVEGALAIPFRPSFPTWLGWLAPEDARLLLVVDGFAIDDVVQACLLVGYERFDGWLAGGMDAWAGAGLPVRDLVTVEAEDALDWLRSGATAVDVREPDEFAEGHLARATSAPLGSLETLAPTLPAGRPVLAYCSAGVRSISGASILERSGVRPVANLRGGYGAWRRAGRD
jgi:rhodanese-related sulfurtransferase